MQLTLAAVMARFRRQRLSVFIQCMESTRRVDSLWLEEIEQRSCLTQQPLPMSFSTDKSGSADFCPVWCVFYWHAETFFQADSIDMVGLAPFLRRYTEYRLWVAQIYSRLRLGPPNSTLAAASGNMILPSKHPSGA